jgi:hypothetical protein
MCRSSAHAPSLVCYVSRQGIVDTVRNFEHVVEAETARRNSQQTPEGPTDVGHADVDEKAAGGGGGSGGGGGGWVQAKPAPSTGGHGASARVVPV